MPKYNIIIKDPETNTTKFVGIGGYPASIPELPDVKMFIHRPYGPNGIWNNEMLRQMWSISEFATGLSLIREEIGTQEQVIEALRAKIVGSKVATNMKDYVAGYIAKHIAQYGIANKE